DDEPRRRPRDQRELLGIDQARDVGQMLVRALPRTVRVGAEAALGPLVGRVRAEGGAFAAGETGQLALDAAPAVFRRVVGDEDAFGRLDALQAAVADGDGPPDDDLAVAVAAGDLFLVAIALPVAVEDPRDRRVPPVD